MPNLAEIYAQQTAGMQRGNTGRYGGITRSPADTAAPIPSNQVTVPQAPHLPGILQKGADFSTQLGSIASQLAVKQGKFAINTPGYVYRDIKPFLKGVASTVTGEYTHDLSNNRKLQVQLDKMQSDLVRDYKLGKISKENYSKRLIDISKSYQDLSKTAKQIASKANRGDVVESAANTAALILSAGEYAPTGGSVTSVGLREGFEEGMTSGLRNLVNKSAIKTEEFVSKIPSVGGKGGLIERNLGSIAKEGGQLAEENLGQYVLRNGKQLATGLLIKRPLFYEQNIGGAKDVYEHILKGQYGSALKSSAWLATQMLEGGPLGAAGKGLSWLKDTGKSLAYGTGSFIDEVSRNIGNGNPNQIARFLTTLEEKAPQEFQEANKTFRILQETNLRAANDDAERAAQGVLAHYTEHGYDLSQVTPSQLYRDMRNWSEADELAQRTLRSGLVKDITPEDAKKYVVVRWDNTAKNGLIDAVKGAGNDRQAMLDTMYEMANRPGVGWGNNKILMNRLENAIVNSTTAQEAADAIKNISTVSVMLDGVPKKVADQLAEKGYSIAAPFGGRKTPIVDMEDTRKLVTGAIKGDIFDTATMPQPELAMFAKGLEKSGLSPRSANDAAVRKLSETMVSSLDELGLGARMGLRDTQGGDVVNGGKAILSKLQQYIENKQGFLGLGRSAAVTDVRQLTSGEIAEALSITKNEAKTVSKALVDAYTKVPLEFRGLGDKVTDTLYKVNPLQKYYSRIQSALRYTYNPFFRVQESVETKLLSHAEANNLIWNRAKDELNEGARILDESGIFTSSLPGEAAQDQVLGRITANITQGQKRDLAGLAYNLAEARGLTLQQMATDHPEELEDALRVIVQYPKKGVLASPLARTMNLAFFPMRYNLKVSYLAAKVLAKQPPAIQLATINSLFKMRDWLKSDEGIRWQSEHADAIQVLSWLTPVNSLQYTLNLLSHKPDSVAELGSLGGLPLGFITQMLDSQGIINLNRPYVNPKTGDVIPKYIPQTAKARVSVALGDLLGSMFTYPGRVLGLPGKASTIRGVVKSFIDTNGTDFEKRIDTQNLTPLQQQWVKVLKGDTSQEAIDKLYNSPAEGQFNGYTLPPLDLPIRPPTTPVQPLPQRTGLPTKAKGRRQKKLPVPIPPR